MGYEAHPEQYEKRYDSEGVIYMRKPEYRAEQEERLCQETEEEKESRMKLIAKKRATRRKEEMDAIELKAALRKAEEIASWLVQSGDVN